MSKQTTVATEAQSATKKLRRGVNNSTQSVSQLKFHEKDSAKNGLFVGHLHSVTVDWSTSENVFNGQSIPRLTFHFASNHTNANEMRHVYQTLFPIPSNVDTIPDGKEEWKVRNVFAWIKHVLDIYYLRGREFTTEEEDALTLPFEDFDEQGNYVPVEVDEVISGYRTLFENAAGMLNGTFKLSSDETPKACYKTADGNYIPVWIKLLRHKKRKNKWINVGQNGDLAFDTFLGNGAIELLKKDKAPSILRLDMSRESITPREVETAPAGILGGGNVLGDVLVTAGNNINAYNDAIAGDDDMPF